MNRTKGSISQDIIIKSFSDLPSLPIVIQKLHGLMENQNIDIKTVSNVIEADPGFTARVLKLVNSPFYGLSRQVSSIGDAITILGFDAVHQLLLTTSMFKTFDSENVVLNMKNFWRHSFGVGIIAKNLINRNDQDTRNEVFLCGILHDIGRLIFLKIDPELFSWFYIKRRASIGINDETEYFGINHQKTGELLAEKWNFPESVVTAISQHQSPLKAKKYQLHAAVINIADILSHALAIGDSGNSYVSEFFPEAWAKLGLSMEQLEECLIKALNEIRNQQEIIKDLCG